MPVDLRFFEHRKVQALVRKFGPAGPYACLFIWSEMYRKGGSCDLSDELLLEDLMSNCRANAEQLHAIIEQLHKYGLIAKTDKAGVFTKSDVSDNLTHRKDVSSKRSANAKQMHDKRRANAKQKHANAEHPHAEERRGESELSKFRDSPRLSVSTQNGTAGPGAFEGSGPPASQVPVKAANAEHAEHIRAYEALLQRDREQAEKNLRAFKAKLAKAGLKLDEEIRKKFEELPLIRQEQMYLHFHRDYLLEGKDAEKQDVMNLINEYNPDHDEPGAAD